MAMRCAALRCAALLLLAVSSVVHAHECTNRRAITHAVDGLDVSRYAGVWFQQSGWGTGARAMRWYVASCAAGVGL